MPPTSAKHASVKLHRVAPRSSMGAQYLAAADVGGRIGLHYHQLLSHGSITVQLTMDPTEYFSLYEVFILCALQAST